MLSCNLACSLASCRSDHTRMFPRDRRSDRETQGSILPPTMGVCRLSSISSPRYTPICRFLRYFSGHVSFACTVSVSNRDSWPHCSVDVAYLWPVPSPHPPAHWHGDCIAQWVVMVVSPDSSTGTKRSLLHQHTDRLCDALAYRWRFIFGSVTERLDTPPGRERRRKSQDARHDSIISIALLC